MKDKSLEFTHSIECRVTRDFAWGFWSDVDNWATVDPAVEWVRLDGPFASGSKGITKPIGTDPNEWMLVEVEAGRRAVIEIPLPEAIVKFTWTFEDSEQGGVRMTQRVTIEGERSADYAEGFSLLEQGIPSGMQRLAQTLDEEQDRRSKLLSS